MLIATRQIGDVLLVTPLLASLRNAYPNAEIDVLVFAGKGGMLEGNPHLSRVIEIAEKPTWTEYFYFLRRIFRHYDLAVNTQANDRAHQYAFLAASKRVGLIFERNWKSAWKRALNFKWAWLDNLSTHTVVQNLLLAEQLGIEKVMDVVPPRSEHIPSDVADRIRTIGDQGYTVVHLNPMWTYKRWTESGWKGLIQYLLDQGMHVFLSGGAADQQECQQMAEHFADNVISLAGRLTLGELAYVMQGARLFVGPDTAVTHLAAATGVPCLALYGPSNPVKWGPWPKGCSEEYSPWLNFTFPWQWRNNVLLLQGDNPLGRNQCVPCYGEGCDQHKGSLSACLQALGSERVLKAVCFLLAEAKFPNG